MDAKTIVSELKKAGERAFSTGDKIIFDETIRRMEKEAKLIDDGEDESEEEEPEKKPRRRRSKAKEEPVPEKEEEAEETEEEPEETTGSAPWGF